MPVSLVEDTDFVWGKTWLFLVRERGSLLEEEVGSLTSGSKQGLESFKGKREHWEFSVTNSYV